RPARASCSSCRMDSRTAARAAGPRRRCPGCPSPARSGWDGIRPSADPSDSGTPAKGFSSLGRCGAGEGVMASDVSPKEIARAGVLVRIPPALRSYTDGQDEVVLEASDVAAMLHALDANFPGIRDRVVDEAGRRRPYVNVFVNEELIGT